MKICALLVPREMKVEHSDAIKGLTDEQLEEAIAAIKASLAARAGEAAKVIDVGGGSCAGAADAGEAHEAVVKRGTFLDRDALR